MMTVTIKAPTLNILEKAVAATLGNCDDADMEIIENAHRKVDSKGKEYFKVKIKKL